MAHCEDCVKGKHGKCVRRNATKLTGCPGNCQHRGSKHASGWYNPKADPLADTKDYYERIAGVTYDDGQQKAPEAVTPDRPTVAPPTPPNTGARNLDALVAQHFRRLDEILANTISQLEELKSQTPNAVFKSEPLPPPVEIRWDGAVVCCSGDMPCEKHSHSELLCRAYYKRCKCLCAECISNCTKRQDDYDNTPPAMETTQDKVFMERIIIDTPDGNTPKRHTADGNCVCDGDTPE
jgi:hypothetical protein